MPQRRTAAVVFDQEFLPIRARLLELAASLDRLGRADGDVTSDPRWHQIHAAINTLLLPAHDRAEQIQLLFSRPYEETWKRDLASENDE